MRVNYFDLGPCKGIEMHWVLRHTLPILGISDYRVYAFEACSEYAKWLKEDYSDNPKVEIINKAISDSNEPVRLYYSKNGVGHSIYSTKNNVVESKYEEVQGVKFSDWFKKNIKYNKSDINILKVNIEGAEFPLFMDIVENDIHTKIDLFCGQGHDIEKVAELSPRVQEYYDLLETNGIVLHRFSEHKPQKNIDITQKIKEIMDFKKMIWPNYKDYIKDTDLNEQCIRKCNNFSDVEVPDKYKTIWKDISFLVQLNKAKNHRLSEDTTKKCLSQLIKRPYYLSQIANSFNAKNILEVGTAEGLQFYSFAEQVSHVSDGHVWSCDIVDKRNKKYSEIYKNNTTFCLGTSKELGQQVNEKIDLFYIDASHKKGAVLEDVKNVKHLQSENPIWIFDDFDTRFGCYEDIQQICKSVGNFMVYRVGDAASGNPNHQVIVFGYIP